MREAAGGQSQSPMDLRAAAQLLAGSRAAFGAGLALAPGLAGPTWIGRSVRDPGTRVVTRAMGARDLALGVGGLLAIREGDGRAARRWFGAQVATDTVDLLATLRAARELPRPAAIFAATAAAGSVAVAAGYALRAGDREPSGGAASFL